MRSQGDQKDEQTGRRQVWRAAAGMDPFRGSWGVLGVVAEAKMNAIPAPAALWGDGHEQARPPSDFAGDEGLV